MSDIEAVIQNAVEDSQDVGVEEAAPAEEAAPVAEAAVADPAAPAADEDPFAKEHGLTPKRPDNRENRIPYSQVKKIAENQVKKAQAEWDAKFAPDREKLTTYEQRVKQVDQIEALMQTDGERFIRMLAAANPDMYGRFAKVLEQQQEAAQAAAPAQDDPQPAPDLDLGDGRMTYSVEGMERRMAWERRQAAKEIEGRLGERIKPFEDQQKADAERRKAEAEYNDRVAKVTERLEKARKWPGFTDNEAEIREALKTNESFDLHDAYVSVVIPKMSADKTRVRQEVLAELKKAPTATAVASPQTPAANTVDPSVDPIEAIIRSAVRAIPR